jgi:methylated-DNA-[protein]-cysteine S-methyltransferase
LNKLILCVNIQICREDGKAGSEKSLIGENFGTLEHWNWYRRIMRRYTTLISEPLNTFTTYYQSPIGQLRISGTDSYISEIIFYDTANKSGGHRKNLPPLAIQCIEQLIQYFQGERRQFDLPISQQGTPFQQEVWSELMQIPYGRTISYLDLARKLGDTKATRAVAAANGKNNVCIVVPCHRVIGSNGDLVGYSGGLKNKQALLALERKHAHGVQTLF